MHAVLWIVAFAGAVLATGVLYQWIGGWRDRRRFTASGRWVTIGNGSKLYLFEMGAAEPTVLFEAGFGATHLNWRGIQDAISETARTVAYDRSGLGWSSRCRTSRIPSNISVELHQMLHRAGLKPPFILVGHSFGGLVMRRYALLYPDEVAGVVLIDPMRCNQWPPLDPSKQSQIDLGHRLIRFAMPVASCGLARLMVNLLFCRASHLSDQIVGAAGAHKTPRAHADQDRSEKNAARRMACGCGPLVASRILCRSSQPYFVDPRNRDRDGCGGADPRHSRYGSDARQYHSALTGRSQPDRRQC